MLVELAEDSAKLEVTLAQVAHLEQLGGNVELACGVVVRGAHGLGGLPHLVHEALVIVEISDLALQIEYGAVQVARTVFQEGHPWRSYSENLPLVAAGEVVENHYYQVSVHVFALSSDSLQ